MVRRRANYEACEGDDAARPGQARFPIYKFLKKVCRILKSVLYSPHVYTRGEKIWPKNALSK